MREPRRVHSDPPGRRSLSSKELVHAMKKLGVQALHCLLKKREVRSSVKTKSIKRVGIEVEIGNKVTIPKSHVELESQQDKESRKWELDRSTILKPDIRNRIAKADKLIKEEVIAANLGRIV